MNRLPAFVFTLLAAATVGAFFVVQHLKVSTPLIAGFPAPSPAVINPRSGVVCGGVDHRRMVISFYLLHRSDDVDVDVIDPAGTIVATLATGRHMQGGAHPVRSYFTWDGREDSGRFAPDGPYFVQVSLVHQGRTVVIAPTSGGPPTPVRVETRAPVPVVGDVRPRIVPVAASARVRFRVSGTEGHAATVRIFRTDLPGGPRELTRYLIAASGASDAAWDGRLAGRRVPAGIYLIGADVTDAACNTGHFPPRLPPRPGTTAGAGVTVRYVAVEPPLVPVSAGTAAQVLVDARQRPYTWALRAAGSRRVLASGGPVRSVSLTVPLPARGAALDELTVRAGAHREVVPLLGTGAHAPLLVVLPAVSWQGRNPVDDVGDGVPNTLTAGLPVRLARPFATGLPADWGGAVELVRELEARHRRFELTTDLALAQNTGPSLASHSGVILAGGARWVPDAVAAALRGYVRGGGHVLSLGLHTLRATVRLSGGLAESPSPFGSVDIFGLRHGALVRSDRGLASTVDDGLGLLGGTAGVYRGLAAGGYEPVTGAVAPAALATEVGTAPGSLMVAGARLGAGWVVETGLRGLAASALASPSGDAAAILDAVVAHLLGGR